MTVTTPFGRNINIHFVHSSHDATDPNFQQREEAGAIRVALDADAKLLNRRITLCELSEVRYSGASGQESTEEYNVLGQGLAVCHPKDNFNKAAGRKTALGAALKAAGLNLEERETIWLQYRTAFPVKERSSRSRS